MMGFCFLVYRWILLYISSQKVQHFMFKKLFAYERAVTVSSVGEGYSIANMGRCELGRITGGGRIKLKTTVGVLIGCAEHFVMFYPYVALRMSFCSWPGRPVLHSLPVSPWKRRALTCPLLLCPVWVERDQAQLTWKRLPCLNHSSSLLNVSYSLFFPLPLSCSSSKWAGFYPAFEMPLDHKKHAWEEDCHFRNGFKLLARVVPEN